MKVSSFFKLVEIQTKVASVFPFFFGTLYGVWTRGSFRWLPALVMLLSLICIDMATTAVNNYMDYKRAIRREGYGYEEHNAIVKDQVEIDRVKIVIITLLGLGLIFGLVLVWLTDWIVLLVGVVSAGVGILYSYGPVPISRTPLGEIFSGGFMGILIPFLAFYIQYPVGTLVAVGWQLEWMTLGIDAGLLLKLVFVSVPFAVGIANIMLANNICDLEDDLVNRRYTLVAYIGQKQGTVLYQVLFSAAYGVIVIGTALGWLPIFAVIGIATGLPVYKLTREFSARPDKKETFVNAVKSFVLIAAGMVLTMLIAVTYNYFF
ncbi:1,4-dihydroxy-2-naphthoate polyprenyltransferase [Acidaminobacter hydrogenoformans]|uniref:1,4-dihydroxy-2-naphthoate octaprenyltransferase n=1 Tax=Acidaminobacter hydrogenoformans DSM 2784 TaxID=1120920 RepID=A0A1G5RSR6_9FIRM|nr:1,4-dihydroxy-2-naphthoate polyprenyltransferase [Acidaminobacter hydrogenoformans]SCZ77057.1 1,4-dihydroxy-2-naphthoate octaprenyltransferase [Acidaminobacter hydrogenoformans DSM 2784]